MLDQRDRPEIEITPEMLDEGMNAYWESDVEEIGSRAMVRMIFERMLEKSKHLKDR